MKIIDTIINKVKSSRAVETITKFINGIFGKYSDSDCDKAMNQEGFLNRTAERITRILKKFTSKLDDAATEKKVNKIIKKIIRVISIVATLAFAVLVVKIMIKILPIVLMAVAFVFAVEIIATVVTGVVDNAING